MFNPLLGKVWGFLSFKIFSLFTVLLPFLQHPLIDFPIKLIGRLAFDDLAINEGKRPVLAGFALAETSFSFYFYPFVV